MQTLAFDLGASSGRAMVGNLQNGKLNVQEIYRFSNNPVTIDKKYWDILRLFHEIKKGLVASSLLHHKELKTVGIDTWGLSFGFLGRNGELLGNPVHYRDDQANGMVDEVTSIIPKAELYSTTGCQFTQVNSLYHIYAMKKEQSSILENAETMLMIADLLRYFLTGEQTAEETISSTTQLYNPITNNWDYKTIHKLGIPDKIFPEMIQSGTYAGSLRPSICAQLNVPSLQVVAVGEHDTASAVVSVPAETEDFAYISCGTWSLLGTELDKPIINDQAFEWNFTNEKGVLNTYRLLKNIMGLWILQQCKSAWDQEGHVLSYGEMTELAANARPFRSFIDPDHDMFLNPLSMPDQIIKYCSITHQPVPETKEAIIRCVLESLVFKYQYYIEKLEKLTEKSFKGLHIVGGGAHNTLLCQFTANAIGKPVFAGPVEATAIGNLLMQYMAMGEVRNLSETREIVRHSFHVESYEPRDCSDWTEAYGQFLKITDL
ncbi:Rhamnulokinase [Chlamydia abortus]|nr:Rhamnulokinase [Chlamydia abortus]